LSLGSLASATISRQPEITHGSTLSVPAETPCRSVAEGASCSGAADA
jgi:hypothetical protein